MGSKGGKWQQTPLSKTEVLADDNMASKIFMSAASTGEPGERHKVFMMERCNRRLGQITQNMRGELRRCICQEVPKLFSSGEHRTATKIVAWEIVVLNPDANMDKMLNYRSFDANGLLVKWDLRYCCIGKLQESFGELLCTGTLELDNNQLESLPLSFGNLSVGGDLVLSANKLRCLPPNFEQIRVGGDLYLMRNPELTGVSTEFPNVKGWVSRH